MDKMPIVIARFLALPEKEGLDIYDKFAYLIKSLDGDNYYLFEFLPEEGVISEELGIKIYEEIIEGVTYKDIFNWYENWMVVLVAHNK